MTTSETKRRKARNAYERERRRLHRLHLIELAARAKGFELIAGVDEVGRGPLAGPVVAACVLVGEPLMLRGLNDSKQVRASAREELDAQIKARARGWGIGVASVEEIEQLNIYWASILAMERAIAAIPIVPHYLITDAVRIRSYAGPQEPVIKGDARCAVVAAASIVAKVYRDAILDAMDREDPRYGYAEHKGYATPRHLEALAQFGPSIHHRPSFCRVRDAQLSLGIEGFDDDERSEPEPA